MTITLTPETTDTTVDQVVAEAWDRWQEALDGAEHGSDVVAVNAELIAVAEAADQPLCLVWGRLCCTPHGLTERSCCQTWVCDDHDGEHDKHCSEFAAQLLEEAL